jgi:hypothetical protein
MAITSCLLSSLEWSPTPHHTFWNAAGDELEVLKFMRAPLSFCSQENINKRPSSMKQGNGSWGFYRLTYSWCPRPLPLLEGELNTPQAFEYLTTLLSFLVSYF